MLRRLASFVALPIAAVGALLAPAPASAAVIYFPPTVYYFSGTCIDCNGVGTAELTLSNYTTGQAVTSSNFVSLHYDGSNLIGAFTISASEDPYLFGQINAPLPSAETFSVFGQTNYFQTRTDGSWFLGAGALVADYGTNGVYSANAPLPAAVPEPLSLTLMLTGLAGTALLARRRASKVS